MITILTRQLIDSLHGIKKTKTAASFFFVQKIVKKIQSHDGQAIISLPPILAASKMLL